jgi:hypothetical protein
MKIIPFLFLALVLLGCNDGNKPEEEKKVSRDASDTTRSNSPDIPETSSTPSDQDLTGCYMRVMSRDTFVAKLQQGNEITGKLSFDNYQKDGSSGQVSGRLENGLIKLVYSFQSEGTNSVMDVYFKPLGNELIRGIGEMETRGDTAYFKNPALVSFPEKDKIFRMPCDQVPDKYQ